MSLLLITGLGVGTLSLASYIRQKATQRMIPHQEAKSQSQVIGPAVVASEPPNFWAFLSKHFVSDPPDFETAEFETTDSEAKETGKDKKWLTPLSLTSVLAVASIGVALVPESALSEQWREFLTVVLMSATVGIGTNYIAIWMLFFPVKPLPLIRLQGIIPRKREEIILGLAAGIRRNLLDEHTIQKAIHDSDVVRKGMDKVMEGFRQKVEDPVFRKDLVELIRQTVRAFLSNELFRGRVVTGLAVAAERLPSKALASWLPRIVTTKIGGLLAEKVQQNKLSILEYLDTRLDLEIKEICDTLLKGLETMPERVEQQREFLENYITRKLCSYAASFDIESMIKEKMQSMEESEFYQMINEVTENELANLQYLGAALGGIAGVFMFFSL